MGRAIRPNYEQQFLLPPSLEEWVPADHPARFVREFVEALPLEEMGFVDREPLDGRPSYASSLLLKIWLYGYFQRIRSSRKLETACGDQLPFLWLSAMLRPDHNTLWRFWHQHRAALRSVFKQTVQVAVRTGCVGMVLQAVDGTKIAAAASGPKGWNKEHMEKLLAELDAVLAQTELEIAAEAPEAPSCRLPEGLAERRVLREQVRAGLAQLESDRRGHYHPAEPQARRMKVGDTNRYAYNAQAVADAKAGIIVASEVTREETDRGQLVPMITQAQENLGVASGQALTVADTGYGSGADLQAAADQGLTVLAPPAEGHPAKDNPYAAQHFRYDPLSQSVMCPKQRQLDREGETIKHGQRVVRFRCHHRDCPVRALCSRDPKGRQFEVWPHTPEVQAMRSRLAEPAQRQQWRRRAGLIEPCFAQIKEHDGFRRWTYRGLENVRTQWRVLCATLNLRILHQRWRQTRCVPPHSGGSILVSAA